MKNTLFRAQFSLQNAENPILGLWNFKFFWGSMPSDPCRGTEKMASYSRVFYSNLVATSIFIEMHG